MEQQILIMRVYCGTNSLKRVKEAFETDFPIFQILLSQLKPPSFG